MYLRVFTRSLLPWGSDVKRRLPILIRGRRLLSAEASTTARTDLETLFLDRRVRYLLKHLTCYDPIKVFTRKSVENLNSPKYRLMTDEQLNQEIEKADTRAIELLQMPPVKYPQDHKPEVLEEDIALQGFLDPAVKVVFLDATPGFVDSERLIVVREPSGVLREADREERHRTNQIFYPVDERNMDMPKMFDEPYLTNMLNRGAHKLLLDNLCLHFEPDDKRYIDLSHHVYDHLALKANFDSLLSTRHYGGMVYYYCFYRRADSLLLHLIHEARLDQAHALLRLFYIVNPRSEAAPVTFETSQLDLSIVEVCKRKGEVTPTDLEKEMVDLLKIYTEYDASSANLKPRLQLAWQKLMDEASKDKSAASN